MFKKRTFIYLNKIFSFLYKKNIFLFFTVVIKFIIKKQNIYKKLIKYLSNFLN